MSHQKLMLFLNICPVSIWPAFYEQILMQNSKAICAAFLYFRLVFEFFVRLIFVQKLIGYKMRVKLIPMWANLVHISAKQIRFLRSSTCLVKLKFESYILQQVSWLLWTSVLNALGTFFHENCFYIYR